MSQNPVSENTFYLKTHDHQGFSVVDSLINGKAMGGTRIAPGVSIHEVRKLARGMTLKLAMARVLIGGSKAGICLPNGNYNRQQMLKDFGQAAKPQLWGGVYMGTDLGCSFQDRSQFFDAAKYTVPIAERYDWSWSDYWASCGNITGYGAFEASIAALNELNIDAKQCRVAIQGFGKAGKAMASYYAELGISIVAVSDINGTLTSPDGIDIENLMKWSSDQGIMDPSQKRDHETWSSNCEDCLSIDADILALAARGDAIHENNWHKVNAKILVECANHPVTPDAQKQLHGKGVVIIPDIVASCASAAITGILLLDEIPKEILSLDKITDWSFERMKNLIHENIHFIAKYGRDQKLSLPEAAKEVAFQRAVETHGWSNQRPAIKYAA